MAVEPRKEIHEDREGEYRLSYTLSLTSDLDGIRWSMPHPINLFFDVLLTVHLSIILVINQLNAQNLVL